MHKIKLLDYQLHAIKARLDSCVYDLESHILNTFKSHCIEDLYFSDYEKIMDEIDIHSRRIEKYY